MKGASQNKKLAIAKKTKIKRRSFWKKAGLISILVGGSLVWRAFERRVFSVGEGVAYEPWDDWQTYEGKDPLALVSAAILAANPHNTQPWLFQVLILASICMQIPNVESVVSITFCEKCI